jgi:hypothetical protein
MGTWRAGLEGMWIVFGCVRLEGDGGWVMCGICARRYEGGMRSMSLGEDSVIAYFCEKSLQ